MITYRFLSSADLVSLYECFLEAFADYQADMRMSQQQFEQRLARDGVQMEITVGTFDDSRMIGFCMNARGVWQERTTAYDSGTAMIPAYRGKGVAKELFAFMVPRLKESCDQYLLEVLTSNEPAVSLYRKLGFVETRRFAVFRGAQPVKPLDDLPGVTVRRVERPEWDLFKSFWDGEPSWQNSIDAVKRIVNDSCVVGAYVDEACVGYGVVFRPSPNVMQLAVAPAQRRKGIGSRILSALQLEINECLRVTNVDEELKGPLAFYEANGFEMVLEQFEMMKAF